MAKTVSYVLKKSGFELSEWGSTSKKEILALPGKPVNEIQLDLEGPPTKKALGMKFYYQSDSFMPTANVPINGKTKRELFRAWSSVYNPFGMLASSHKRFFKRTTAGMKYLIPSFLFRGRMGSFIHSHQRSSNSSMLQ